MKKFTLLAAMLLPAIGVMAQITDKPEGRTQLYVKSAFGTYDFLGTPWPYTDRDAAAMVVYGDNDEAYIWNMLGLAEYNTYIKGTVSDGKITISLPQIVKVDDYGWEIMVCGVKGFDYTLDGHEAFDYLYDPSITEFSYNIEEDGALTLVIPGDPFDGENFPDYAIGYCYADDGTWLGYSDFQQRLTPVEGSIETMPEGVEPVQYVFLYDGYGILVDVAFTEDAFYVKGLNPNVPEGVFKANIAGDHAFVPQNQITGIFDNYFIWTKCVYDNPDFDYESDDDVAEFVLAPDDVEYEFLISEDRKTISSVNNDGVYLAFNGSPTRLFTLACYRDFSLTFQESYEGVPNNPTDPYWYDETEMGGICQFFFNLRNLSTTGEVLLPENLYYRIFVNGELMTFVQKENTMGHNRYQYPGMTEPTTLVPWEFSNIQDINVFPDTPRRMIGIYRDDVREMGVQAVYIIDGVENYSDLLVYNVISGKTTYVPAEEANVSAISTEITDGSVYNLQGVKVGATVDALNTLPAGLYIVNGRKIMVK